MRLSVNRNNRCRHHTLFHQYSILFSLSVTSDSLTLAQCVFVLVTYLFMFPSPDIILSYDREYGNDDGEEEKDKTKKSVIG